MMNLQGIKEIKTILAEKVKVDKNWSWDLKEIKQMKNCTKIIFHWEYLNEYLEDKNYFELVFVKEINTFLVKSPLEETISAEDNLENAIEEMVYYAMSRY